MQIDISRIPVAPFEQLQSAPRSAFALRGGERWHVLADHVFADNVSVELVVKSEHVVVALYPYLVDNDTSLLFPFGSELAAKALSLLPAVRKVHFAVSDSVEQLDGKFRVWFGAAGCE